MHATEFEFRHRFWLLSSIFGIGFACYSVDHTNTAIALAHLLAGHHPERFAPLVRLVFWLGALVTVACGAIRTWAAAYLASSVVHDTELHAERLVADGPYRHLRNPLYLGTILLAMGLGPMASRLGFVVLMAGIWLFTHRLILREEGQLLRTQGESYRRYFEAVPRLIPSLRPRVAPGAGRPDWWDGIAGEAFIWGLVAGAAAFAYTLRLAWFWACMATGFAIALWQHRQMMREKSEP